MLVTIRLYKRYDIDLLTLYHHPDFCFKKKFRQAIQGYIREEPMKFSLPDPSDNTFPYETVAFQMNLKDEKDLQFIKNIKSGYRNCILKNIFRNSLQGVYYYYCSKIHNAELMSTLNHQSEKLQNENTTEVVKKRKQEKQVVQKHENKFNQKPTVEVEAVDIFDIAGDMLEGLN